MPCLPCDFDMFFPRHVHPAIFAAYQRRATAFRAIRQYKRAVQDLEAALGIEPNNAELQQQLTKARREADEAEKQRLLKKAVTKV
jgi:hypothetical protein